MYGYNLYVFYCHGRLSFCIYLLYFNIHFQQKLKKITGRIIFVGLSQSSLYSKKEQWLFAGFCFMPPVAPPTYNYTFILG